MIQPPHLRRNISDTLIIGCLALVTAGLLLFQLSRPNLLFGLSIDGPVYLGAAARLAHGLLPYRNFVFVQPPGIVVLASPFGVLSRWTGTRDALALMRLSMPLVGAVNVILVGLIIRHRGRLATLFCCGTMAVMPAEIYSAGNGMLEITLNCACLLGLWCVFDEGHLATSRRRMLLGGMALAAALSIKAPGIIPGLVVAGICLPSPRRHLLPLLTGVGVGVAVLCLPFFVAAPRAFVQDVVLAQLGRVAGAARAPLYIRISDLAGMPAVAGALLGALIFAATAAAFRAGRGRPSPLETFALVATALGLLSLLLPAQFYPQYPAVLAPPAALLLGSVAIRLTTERTVPVVRSVALLGIATCITVATIRIDWQSSIDVSARIDAAIPAGACVLTDSPRFLVTSNRFISAVPGCVPITDAYGTQLALGNSAAAVTLWRTAVAHASYVVLGIPASDLSLPPAAGVAGDIHRCFSLRQGDGVFLYVRHPRWHSAPTTCAVAT